MSISSLEILRAWSSDQLLRWMFLIASTGLGDGTQLHFNPLRGSWGLSLEVSVSLFHWTVLLIAGIVSTIDFWKNPDSPFSLKLTILSSELCMCVHDVVGVCMWERGQENPSLMISLTSYEPRNALRNIKKNLVVLWVKGHLK